jgi:hypothetical protein
VEKLDVLFVTFRGYPAEENERVTTEAHILSYKERLLQLEN